MPLTHVQRWSKEKKCWVPVSIEEACEMFPDATVPADAKLFMCDLCKKYVTLTSGTQVRRYFRHSFPGQGRDFDRAGILEGREQRQLL